MSSMEWMVLIVGLGLGWGVVSMLTGQRKRPQPPAVVPGPLPDAEPAPTSASTPSSASTPAPAPAPNVAPKDPV